MVIENLNDLKNLAKKNCYKFKRKDVILLKGDLGAGKTSLVTYIAEFLNSKDKVSSPSFSLVNIYRADIVINHLDLYRLEEEKEIESFNFEDYFYPIKSLTFIEWPEMAKSYLPKKYSTIEIIKIDDNKRDINIFGKLKERMEEN